MMHPLKIRTQIIIYSVIVLFTCFLISFLFIYKAAKSSVIEESREMGLRYISQMEMLLTSNDPASNKEIDTLCKKIGNILKARITIITREGVVIADSAIDYNDIKFMENHISRQEINVARVSGVGFAIRYSPTKHQKMIYVARKVHLPYFDKPLFLRVAFAYKDAVSDKIKSIFPPILAAFVLSGVLLISFAYIFSNKITAPLYTLKAWAKEAVTGDLTRLHLTGSYEFESISSYINQSVARIDKRIKKITKRKNTLETVFNSMKEGVVIIDASGRINAINPVAASLSEYKGNFAGKKPIEIFMKPEIQEICDQAITEKQDISKIIGPMKGKYFEIHARWIPIGGILLLMTDRTDSLDIQKMRRDFVANVSHELKTPLTSILGYTDALLSEKFNLTDDVKTFLSTINRNAEQMLSLVKDLLELSMIQEKARDLPLSPVNIASAARSGWETCRHIAEAKDIDIIFRIPSTFLVKADKTNLVRVFVNLFKNAVQHSPPSTSIEVWADKKDDNIIIAIKDMGPGVPEAHRKRIFERFYRIDRGRNKKNGGTGLGLSICKNIITSMNGSIWVQDPSHNHEQGAVFCFSLKSAETGNNQ